MIIKIFTGLLKKKLQLKKKKVHNSQTSLGPAADYSCDLSPCTAS